MMHLYAGSFCGGLQSNDGSTHDCPLLGLCALQQIFVCRIFTITRSRSCMRLKIFSTRFNVMSKQLSYFCGESKFVMTVFNHYVNYSCFVFSMMELMLNLANEIDSLWIYNFWVTIVILGDFENFYCNYVSIVLSFLYFWGFVAVAVAGVVVAAVVAFADGGGVVVVNRGVDSIHNQVDNWGRILGAYTSGAACSLAYHTDYTEAGSSNPAVEWVDLSFLLLKTSILALDQQSIHSVGTAHDQFDLVNYSLPRPADSITFEVDLCYCFDRDRVVLIYCCCSYYKYHLQ